MAPATIITIDKRSRIALLLLVALAGALVFWNLRFMGEPGGDTAELAGWVASDQPVYYYRAPATFFAHQAVYRIINNHGGSARDAMAVNSAIAGGVFLVALLMISTHPVFLFVAVATKAVLLFAGHEENYGYVNALLVLFFACALRVWRHADDDARRRRWAWTASIVFVMVCAAHMMGVFYAPALLVLAIGVWQRRLKHAADEASRPDWREEIPPWLVPAVVFMVLAAVAPVIMQQVGRVTGLDNNTTRLVPLFPTDDIRYGFTLFSRGHFQFLYFIYSSSAPLGTVLVLALFWRFGRDAFARWLALCCLCGAAWTFFWHPDLFEGDWDLFSNVAFPLNCLGGLLAARAYERLTAGE